MTHETEHRDHEIYDRIAPYLTVPRDEATNEDWWEAHGKMLDADLAGPWPPDLGEKD